MGLFDTNLGYDGLASSTYGDYYNARLQMMLNNRSANSVAPPQIPALQRPDIITKQQKLLLLETL